MSNSTNLVEAVPSESGPNRILVRSLDGVRIYCRIRLNALEFQSGVLIEEQAASSHDQVEVHEQVHADDAVQRPTFGRRDVQEDDGHLTAWNHWPRAGMSMASM